MTEGMKTSEFYVTIAVLVLTGGLIVLNNPMNLGLDPTMLLTVGLSAAGIAYPISRGLAKQPAPSTTIIGPQETATVTPSAPPPLPPGFKE